MLKYLSVILEIMAFLTHLLRSNFCPVPTPFSPDKTFPHPSKKSFEQTRDNIRMQTSKHYWPVSSRFMLPLLWKSDKKRPCMKSL